MLVADVLFVSGRATDRGADRSLQKTLDHLLAPSPERNLPKMWPNVSLVSWKFVPISLYLLTLADDPFVISRK